MLVIGCSSVDGLSVQRLTLLGRVHVARVAVEHFTVSGKTSMSSLDSTPVKAKSKRKPPRPNAKPDKG